MNDRADLDRADLDRTGPDLSGPDLSDLDLIADEILALEAETLAISDYTDVTGWRVDASTDLTGDRRRLRR